MKTTKPVEVRKPVLNFQPRIAVEKNGYTVSQGSASDFGPYSTHVFTSKTTLKRWLLKEIDAMSVPPRP